MKKKVKKLKAKKVMHRKKKHAKKKVAKKKNVVEKKIKKTLSEFSHGELHSGSKTGPKVTNKAQALAIGYSEGRKAKKKRKK